MTIKSFLFPLLLLFFSALPAQAELNIVVSTPWLKDLAQTIGGTHVRVTAFVRPGQDAHHVEPKPSLVLAARKADLILISGLGAEADYLPVILAECHNPEIQPGRSGYLDASRFVTPLGTSNRRDRSLGLFPPLGNPHYRYSPTAVSSVAVGIAERLAYLDPAHRNHFRDNLAHFQGALAARESAWRTLPLQGKRFAAAHRQFEYLARDFGFSITAYLEHWPEIEPPWQERERFINHLKADPPDGLLASEPEDDLLDIADAAHIPLRVLPDDVGAENGIKTWLDLIEASLRALTAQNKSRPSTM